eukprot:CAMPEP_0185723710 /NCGR_PEP_ID=MMETSP1171-20130828/457_1 /TAXON_ID=374046 /ORGANISM="Helicotheca tamensis, Strain CCMP826" /LENGTH=137 /DNA_ID=CAMNT_0028391455 /DNA_START=28 /DNA_END=441 /DNA_ORIENTATION=+
MAKLLALVLGLLGAPFLLWPTIAFTPTPNFISVSAPRNTFQRAPLLGLSDEQIAQVEEDSAAAEPAKPAVKCPDCDLCDGSGRILGGIAVILPWWPIKAYRPCPNFINAGGRYIRSGQPLDEIAFGRDSSYNPDGNN